MMTVALAGLALAASAQTPPGRWTIHGKAGVSDIVITATARVAGAINSLTWNGREFINARDHGRELQSALNLDGPAETYNPTEGGSRADGTGTGTTSRLLYARASGDAMQTINQMAFWLAPGEKSGPNPAWNKTRLSEFLLTKTVRIGYRDMPNVIPYEVEFSMPVGERHTAATIEAVTGYMPPEFDQYFQVNPVTWALEPLPHTHAEGANPLVFAVKGGAYAMGIYAPPQTRQGMDPPAYGWWYFDREQVAKWNCVFRLRQAEGIDPGLLAFRMFVIVGDVATVQEAMRRLWAESHGSIRG